MEALTVDVLAIAAAAAWLLVFGWCSAVTRRPALRAGAADPGPGLASAKPALVNLSVTQGRLNGAAYPATILDLAAGGYLTISERAPRHLWCDVPPFSPPGTGLARSERLVLTGAWALAGGPGAPFEALADSYASDARGRWDPFERAVRAEGRRAGITRPRLPAAARLLLYAGAGVVGAAVFAAVYGRSHSGLWAPSAAAFFAFAVLASWARSVGRRDRLTAHGSALGAWAARAAGDIAAAGGTPGLGPVQLSRLARAVQRHPPAVLGLVVLWRAMAPGADRPGVLHAHPPGVLAGAGRLAGPDGLRQLAAAGPGRPAGARWAGGGLRRRRRRRHARAGRPAGQAGRGNLPGPGDRPLGGAGRRQRRRLHLLHRRGRWRAVLELRHHRGGVRPAGAGGHGGGPGLAAVGQAPRPDAGPGPGPRRGPARGHLLR